MLELGYILRLATLDEDNLVLMVPHDIVYWDPKRKERQDKTREFCKWIRENLPHLPTEFRYLNTKQVRNRSGSFWNQRRFTTVNCDKHFVVYGMTRADFMLIKLAWSFKTQVAVSILSDSKPEGSYQYSLKTGLQPTDALVQRLAKKASAKETKVE